MKGILLYIRTLLLLKIAFPSLITHLVHQTWLRMTFDSFPNSDSSWRRTLPQAGWGFSRVYHMVWGTFRRGILRGFKQCNWNKCMSSQHVSLAGDKIHLDAKALGWWKFQSQNIIASRLAIPPPTPPGPCQNLTLLWWVLGNQWIFVWISNTAGQAQVQIRRIGF